MGALFAGLTGSVTGFLSKYVTYALLAAMLGLGVFAGVMWVEKASAEKKAAALTLEVDRQKSEIDGLNATVKFKDTAITELEKTNTVLNAQAQELGKQIEDINNAPETDDGPIAPVLDHALRGLRHGP